jgi:hypothetical protein
LIARRIRILGSQQNDREYLYEALQIAASGKVKVMTETYPLDEIGKAYERVADGKVRSCGNHDIMIELRPGFALIAFDTDGLRKRRWLARDNHEFKGRRRRQRTVQIRH